MCTSSRMLTCILFYCSRRPALHVLKPAVTTNSAKLNNRVQALEQRKRPDRIRRRRRGCFVAAAVCALWAQNTGRNAWLWFFLGLFLNWIALLVMLSKNSKDRALRPQGNG